jgi:hypothetical protein
LERKYTKERLPMITTNPTTTYKPFVIKSSIIMSKIMLTFAIPYVPDMYLSIKIVGLVREAQVIENLPTKHEALSSTPSTTKKRKERKENCTMA